MSPGVWSSNCSQGCLKPLSQLPAFCRKGNGFLVPSAGPVDRAVGAWGANSRLCGHNGNGSLRGTEATDALRVCLLPPSSVRCSGRGT